MTFKELKSEIYNLNWESVDEYKAEPSQLFQAINRAMSIITTEVCPLLSSLEITQRAFKNLALRTLPTEKPVVNIYTGGAPLSFIADETQGKVVSYCFECDGEGVAILSDEEARISIPLEASRIYRRYCGFCAGKPCLSFMGEFSYNVRNVAFYGQKLSDNSLDIPPLGGMMEYDLKMLAEKNKKPRFSALEGCFHWQDGTGSSASGGEYRAFTDYCFEGKSVLLLPPLEAGDERHLKIIYKCGFEPVSEKTEDSFIIELDHEASMLLPLLASYFFWLDDERSRSQEYYNQYEMRRDAILYNKSRPHAVCGVAVGGRF